MGDRKPYPDTFKSAASSDYWGEAMLWDTATRQNTATFRGGSNSVAFSPDGKTLATGDSGIVKLWDIETGTNFDGFPHITDLNGSEIFYYSPKNRQSPIYPTIFSKLWTSDNCYDTKGKQCYENKNSAIFTNFFYRINAQFVKCCCPI